MTPAEHRAQAEADLAARDAGRYPPSTDTYKNLTQSAIAHTLAAIAYFLEPAPEPEVPGLPPGWKIATRQSTDGDRFWRYELTPPAGPAIVSRYRWGESETALGAGIRYAREAVAAGVAPAPAYWDPRSGMDDRALRDNGIRG